MAGTLAGTVAVVTGAGRDIGRAVAVRLAAEGAAVGALGRHPDDLAETVARIRAAGGRALAATCDVIDAAAVEHAVGLAREMGEVRVLAAIAGGGGAEEPVDEVDPAAFALVVAANLLGTFHAVRAVVPGMRAAGGGAIVTCAGGGALFPELGGPCAAYAAAKAGICRLTDQLALELHPAGIRVNALLPGPTWGAARRAEVERIERETGEPHPGRAADRPPEEAAELACWLASDASAPLSGRIVSPDDAWARDPDRTAEVVASLHAATLRRVEPGSPGPEAPGPEAPGSGSSGA